ncbi:MAG: protein translocase subunit SecD [Gammaproteobacteria bacterium]|nr:protein translocase subunit SecD [Gammaproteobacteria bacterium]
MNQYPTWKYVLIIAVILTGVLYALPNLYGDDPAVQISPLRGAPIDEASVTRVSELLKGEGISTKSIEQVERGILVRFNNTEDQMQAKDLIEEKMGENYIPALNLSPATPGWLTALNAAPMYLGLDLRGGVHFLMEVDMVAAARQAGERYVSDLRSILRGEKVRYLSIARTSSGNSIEIKFRNVADLELGSSLIRKEYPRLLLEEEDRGGDAFLVVSISDEEIRETKKMALQQNIITLRNRVNELGVAEPVVQQQGDNRIVVQLPGIQDTARAKEILGATATLEFRMAVENADVQAAIAGRPPVGTRLYKERDGSPILLKKRIIVTGDQIIDAASGIEQQNGSPTVFISLDSKGARKMADTTRENVGKPMAVVFIENKTSSKRIDGELVRTRKKIEEVINVAVIRDQFSKRFQITGLDSSEEARDLALLLRAGALAAPIEIVEERTVGPSLGQDNIDQGMTSVIVGFIVVMIFMAVWYRVFGLVANIALTVNLVMIVAVLSMLQATLTLPGIAGIVLTVGIAVDANVLIFERIREEIRSGNSPQASINAGYDKALSTIADANITTLIAALVLYTFGSGPIKGFAITLSIGIVTSMFTAIMGTRAVINLVYGGRKVKKLSI